MPTVPRRGVAAFTGAVLVSTLSGVLTYQALHQPDPTPICGPDGAVLRVPGAPLACAHADTPPAGVDVADHVSTTELAARPGAGPAAYAAAETQGVPIAVATTANSPDVPCDGDGVSGFRIQPMYVVEAGKTNRYADLLPSLQRWAAGTNDVFNRSAALTGGVRNLRYVTDPGTGGACVAHVLNVTVPSGAMTSFNATISAVQALGYDNPARKYLMWTDATSLCGIASMYPNDDPSQANPNNGSYPQYARIDSGCWGLGNGTNEHSVEAHETLHMLGGVQNSAPHSTKAGHCWDESDTMCYSDGGGYPMKQICDVSREYLLDCNSDDYFSTYPDPGSYLDQHWDAADNRFLIGGGDGTGGGSVGTPTRLGAVLAVNNPAVPGLPTQASVTPVLPPDRTLTQVTWKSGRADCTFTQPGDIQTEVVCAAGAAAPTTLTATLTDSTGATKVITSPLTFATNTSRPVTVGLRVADQAAGDVTTASVCAAAPTPVVATVRDTGTGLPVKGLTVALTKQTATMTAPGAAGAAATSATGEATTQQTATVATTYGAGTAKTAVYAASARTTLPAAVEKCTPTLTGTVDTTDVYYGDPVTVTGTLTRTANGRTVPVAGASLPVTVATTTTVSGTTSTKTTVVGTARTATDGSYKATVKATLGGALAVSLPASVGYTATSVALGDLTVRTPSTTLTGQVDATDVGYGTPITVTGALTRVAGAATTGVSGQSVLVKVTAPGKAPVTIGVARTATDGSYKAVLPAKVTGALSVAFAGAAGLPAATATLGDLTAGTWATQLTAAATPTATAAGKLVTVTGTLTRSYGGVTGPAAGVLVKVYAQAQGATTPAVVSVVTTATGTFTFKAYPKVTTGYTVRVLTQPGYADAAAGPVTVTIS